MSNSSKFLLENHEGKMPRIAWIAREQLTRHLGKWSGGAGETLNVLIIEEMGKFDLQPLIKFEFT